MLSSAGKVGHPETHSQEGVVSAEVATDFCLLTKIGILFPLPAG